MTERLYYKNSDLLEFETTIAEVGQTESGHFCVLDSSAFYPTSGGQFHDTGLLNKIPVSDVIENEKGRVLHITAAVVGNVGDRVRGSVDSQRRIDNCQKHTAQHILSQAFVTLFKMETVSVHLGDQYASIELKTKSVTDEQMYQAEELANQLIFDRLPIEIRFVDAVEAARLPLRKVPDRERKIRIVQIGEFDYSACGGTHCRNSAEVGLIKIIGVEKMRGNLSVKFLAGRLAIEDYKSRFDVTNRLANTLTCHFSDLEERFAKTFEENRNLRKDITRLQAERLPQMAKELADKANRTDKPHQLIESVELSDPKTLGQLAVLVADSIDGLAVLISGDRAALATSKETGIHAGQLAKHLSEKLSLRGGGGEQQAQLAGITSEQMASCREIIERYVAQL